MKITSKNQNQAIAALRKCAMENSNKQTDTGCIRIADLCNDVADYLETLPKTIGETTEKQEVKEFYFNEYVRQEKERASEPISPLIQKDMRKDFFAGWELCKAYYKQKAGNEGVIEAQCTAHKVYRNIDGCDYGDLEFDDYINFTEVGLRDGDALDITIRHRKDETI